MIDKPYCYGTMTESQYLAFIRSALRSKWLRWIPRSKALELAKRPYKGSNPRQKVEYLCAICGEYGSAKEMEVDHYPISAGSILCVDDIGKFCQNLFCEIGNLRVVHKDCHKVHTLAESKGISFEEAAIEKEVINILKAESKEDIINFIEMFDFENKYLTSNEKQRRIALTEIYTMILKEK